MDLYSAAAGLPWRLPVGARPIRYRELRNRGWTDQAIRWRANQHARLTRVHQGIYLPGPGHPELVSRARAALLAASPLAVLGFHTAAQLHGFGTAPTESVHVLVPAGTPFPQRPGVTAHQAVLPLGQPVHIMGLPCAPAARCAIDLARTLTRRDALPVLDAALYAGAVSRDDLLLEVSRHGGLRGVRQARNLVGMADGRSECRQETQLRLILHDAGITGFVPQLPVRGDSGRLLFRLDLGDPVHLIAVEYDGSSHLTSQRLRHDRARHNWLQQHGWLVCYFTAPDLYQNPFSIVATVASARRSRAHRSRKRSSRSKNP
ncbi:MULTISPECIES: hypothetical protein [unclassified Micromonospora]|uniref:hypothetical protein n=1 Tax=unclassified Micromonospora TaxID=2617518 RepID=UPI002FF07EA8